MRRFFIGTLACLAWLACVCTANASAPPNAIAVLEREHQWLSAIAKRDATKLADILAGNFVHVTYRGNVRYREDEIAAVAKPRAYVQKTGEQTVDLVGDVAIVHGINTITQRGHVVMRLRYTDVWTKQAGKWKAVSAQETAIAAK